MDGKTFAQWFLDNVGVTLAVAIASMLGAVGGLAFAKGLTPLQALVIVVLGVGFGSFGSQAAVAYLNLTPVSAGFVALLGGVLAMPILGLLFGVFARLRDRSGDVADRGIDRVLPGAPPAAPPAPKPPETP